MFLDVACGINVCFRLNRGSEPLLNQTGITVCCSWQLDGLLASWELLLASVEMFQEELQVIFQHNMFIATMLLVLA